MPVASANGRNSCALTNGRARRAVGLGRWANGFGASRPVRGTGGASLKICASSGISAAARLDDMRGSGWDSSRVKLAPRGVVG